MNKLKSIISSNLALRRLSPKLIWVWVVCIIMIFIYFILKAKTYFWLEIWFLTEILIISAFTRTVGWKRLISVFFQGIVLSATLTFLLYKLLDIVGVNTNSALINGWVIGFSEELFKLLPLALAIYFLYKKRKTIPNPSDFLILSVMSASGFSILEKTFWSDVSFPLIYGPHLGKLYFFPDALGIYVDGRVLGYIGHAAATGLIGMSIGVAFFLQKKLKKAWVWIIPALIYVWVSVEHALLNSYYEEGIKTLLKLGGGLVTPWIFILFLIIVLVIDARNLFAWLKNRPLAVKLLKEKKLFFFKTLHVFNYLSSIDKGK